MSHPASAAAQPRSSQQICKQGIVLEMTGRDGDFFHTRTGCLSRRWRARPEQAFKKNTEVKSSGRKEFPYMQVQHRGVLKKAEDVTSEATEDVLMDISVNFFDNWKTVSHKQKLDTA